MKTVSDIAVFLLLSVVFLCPAFAQQHAYANPVASVVRAARRRASPAPPVSAALYQRRDTWYEFLLKQFNPDDFDYGAWMEQRRQALLDASVRNTYFRYSAIVTLTLFVLAVLYTKQRIDHRRSMWITAEMMTDLYNHDAYSRQVARDAIQKYNEHIERCNRAVEASEHGVPAEGLESGVERYRAELQSVTAERDTYKRERDLAKRDLAEKERMLADLSFRLDALARKSNVSRDGASTVDVRNADQKLVHHINNLQEQLYAEKRENKRLKGA
ncbi:MAG TPA: hypothetical protein VN577_01590 [Terriglobales bacterium]|nr:hypothetical protein [Terriglobales bacterium]